MNSDKAAPILERDGPGAIITNNDAPMNRMTLEYMDEHEETIELLVEDRSVRAIVIRDAAKQHISDGINIRCTDWIAVTGQRHSASPSR